MLWIHFVALKELEFSDGQSAFFLPFDFPHLSSVDQSMPSQLNSDEQMWHPIASGQVDYPEKIYEKKNVNFID